MKFAPQFLAVQQPFDEEKKIDTNSAHSLKYAQVTDLLVTLTLWWKHLQSAQGEALQNH